MAEVNAKDVFDILLESLKIQADKYKSIVNQDLTHEQRKDFDSEIKQMFELLTSMTNSSTVYTLSEIQALKLQYEVKIQELQTILDNIDVTTVKGDTGLSAYELASQNGFQGTEAEYLESLKGQDGKDLTFEILTPEQKESLKGDNGLSAYELASQNGFQGTEAEYLESLKGQDGKDLTFEMLTSEQKESLKGQNGLSAYELALENGFQGTEAEYLESLKGQDGKDFTFDMFTPEQLQQIANLVSVQTVDLTSILNRIVNLENEIVLLGGSATSPTVDYSNDILITSFVPEKVNFKYFSDFEYVVPDNIENVWKIYKMKDNVFDVLNSYVLTYRFKINSEVFEFVYDMSYVNNGWEILSRTNDNTIIVDALWFNGGVRFNGDNLFLDFTFDSANGNFVPALDVALFVECDNSILDLVCLESSSDDSVVSVWLP